MAYFKGSINFGLVYIPIKLEAMVKRNDISFNQLDKNTMSRVRYQKTCDQCGGKALQQGDIIKAYEYEKDKYVVFSDEDFQKIKTKKDKSITIESFVDLNEIDPLYFDKTYYVEPIGAEKAFSLLYKAISDSNKVGIAKTVIGTQETLVAIRASERGLMLSTMFFADEIKASHAVDTSGVSDKEIQLAQMIIESMTGTFDITKYADEYTQRVMAAIEEKVSGKQITTPVKEASGKVIDLMEALQRSLNNTQVPKTKPKQTAKAIPKKTKKAQ